MLDLQQTVDVLENKNAVIYAENHENIDYQEIDSIIYIIQWRTDVIQCCVLLINTIDEDE